MLLALTLSSFSESVLFHFIGVPVSEEVRAAPSPTAEEAKKRESNVVSKQYYSGFGPAFCQTMQLKEKC